MHGGDRVAQVLARRGVRFVFTLCGGHISPILAGAKALGLRIVDVRHEATAVFAADAVARLTGVPGVAAVTAGPGVTNTITAIKNAQLAQSPLVLIGGAAPTALKGRGALQDIDQRALMAPHVKLIRTVRRVRDLSIAVDEAFDAALAGVPGPVFVECPVDLLYDEKTIREWYASASGKGTSLADRALRWYLRRHVDRMFAPGSHAREPANPADVVPECGEHSVTAALAALARAERPLLLVGSQALACASQAREVASAVAKLGIPVYLSGMARGLLGRESPLQMRHRRRDALRESDCVVLAGVPSDFRLDYGRHVRRSAMLIAANRSRAEARMNRRPDILASGDAGRFLQSLSSRAMQSQQLPGTQWIATLRARDDEREREIDAAAVDRADLVNPIALCRAIDAVAGPNATFVADGGDFVATAAYTVHPRSPLAWLDPGVFGTLGVGAGFALGAKLCRPDDEVWILWGDGACGYGLAEYDTFVRHGVGVIGVVGNDAGWTQIAREQVKLLGDDVATVLARSDYHHVAEGFGASGFLARTPGEARAALESAREAAAQGRPALVNAWLAASDFREGSISM
jgi:thiamine pyrophosphate-dependent acetolactate synthase large subunit-like protein